MSHYYILTAFATVKFMFAPFYGLAFHLSFIETLVFTYVGGFFSACIFYWSAEYFMKRASKKRIAKYHAIIQKGGTFVPKKYMTRTNKAIVKVKRSIGIWGIALYAPLFLSVPIGSIITAKFYGKEKRTFLIVLLGLALNDTIISCLAYAF